MVFSLHALVHCMTLKPYNIICVYILSIHVLRYDLSDLLEHFDSFSKFSHLQAWLTLQSVGCACLCLRIAYAVVGLKLMLHSLSQEARFTYHLGKRVSSI